jgi:hypothetical protein
MVMWRDGGGGSPSLVDILDRVLDKGLVVAGDIRVTLANVELLTIRIRLLVCSVDKAQEIGLDWWKHDGFLSSSGHTEAVEQLNQRLALLEDQLRTAKAMHGDATAEPEPELPTARPRRARRS